MSYECFVSVFGIYLKQVATILMVINNHTFNTYTKEANLLGAITCEYLLYNLAAR